ncbi:MAG: MmgE/PrpD family protein [Anaerolineae bacterium]|jgi:2-methylcitrate dehydratase PrpD
METWVTKDLATYAVETQFEDYPHEVVERAKILILDSIGCMFGGCQTNLGEGILTPIRSMGGAEEATIVGGGVRVPTIQAAFVNGTTANALDYDDTLLGIGHPGASVIPAALAIGEWTNASGEDVLNAILIGYDVGDRIGLAIQPTYERLQNVWGVGTWQTFGAVAAAAKMLNLDLKQTLNAYGVAGATAPLPNTQKWGWALEERPIHWVKEPTGWPCWTGTTAAVLAKHGFIGNNYILDGDNGFWIMAGSDQCDYDRMTEGLGSAYEVVDNIAIKPYSSCRWQHATLDCVKQLKTEHNLGPEDVEEVVVHSFAWVKTHELYGPADMVDAQFCIPYTVTMVLLGLHPGPAWYTDENLKSEEVLELSKKVRVEVDPELDKAYFDRDQLAARVEITTRRGGKFETFVDVPTGDPRNPLTVEEIEDKFRNQALYSLDEEEVEDAMGMIADFENLDSVSGLMSLLAG